MNTRSSDTLGVVGLGVMGAPMCANLLKQAGRPMAVHGTAAAAVEDAVAQGAAAAQVTVNAFSAPVCVAPGNMVLAISTACETQRLEPDGNGPVPAALRRSRRRDWVTAAPSDTRHEVPGDGRQGSGPSPSLETALPPGLPRQRAGLGVGRARLAPGQKWNSRVDECYQYATPGRKSRRIIKTSRR